MVCYYGRADKLKVVQHFLRKSAWGAKREGGRGFTKRVSSVLLDPYDMTRHTTRTTFFVKTKTKTIYRKNKR